MIKNQPSIAKAWDKYRQIMIPADAPDIQTSECHLAFYAGAATLFYGIMQSLDPGDEPTTADMSRMDAIHNEIKTFAATFDAQVRERRTDIQ